MTITSILITPEGIATANNIPFENQEKVLHKTKEMIYFISATGLYAVDPLEVEVVEQFRFLVGPLIGKWEDRRHKTKVNEFEYRQVLRITEKSK